ncbi:MAG: protein kinase [Candidatus Riflebacteria bacterium]|nr:protein kinase [Candidatus Riflebacteria bacterium]
MTDGVLCCPHCPDRVALVVDSSGRASCPSCGRAVVVGAGPETCATTTPPDPILARFSQAFMTQYRIIRTLGEGGMGKVYLARQIELDRLVAVKVVRGDELSTEQIRRLVKEAKVLASLNHTNIVAVHGAGHDGGLPYVVCEYVEGSSLQERLRDPTRLSLRQALRIVLRVLGGLKVAHDKGVVHRDLKPANIFLSREGEPKIGDFGLARAQHLPSGTVAGKIMGTPAYMSPEQCRGQRCTPASDLYAVGVVLFEVVTGQLPFPGPTIPEHLYQHMMTEPPLASSVRPGLPGELDEVIERALEKDPARRFQGASEFRKALLRIYRTVAPGKKSSPKRPKPPPPDRFDPVEGRMLADRYRLVRLLGHGGMGQVWLARDGAMEGSEVAVKLLPLELWCDSESRTNLIKEARLSLKLTHPNIVRLMNLEPGDPPFLVMEFVAGRTLADELASRNESDAGPMTPREALPILEGVAAALDHAHHHGIIHRDLKPSNVLLETGPDGCVRAKLADFGVAAELASFRTRQTGMVPTGTLAYMSPEQMACQKLDVRSDVYALGATLYQMLTLSPPFSGGDLAWAIQNAPVPEPEGVPSPVAAVVLRALAKQRDERPRTVGALVSEFSQALARVGLADRISPPIERGARDSSDPVWPARHSPERLTVRVHPAEDPAYPLDRPEALTSGPTGPAGPDRSDRAPVSPVPESAPPERAGVSGPAAEAPEPARAPRRWDGFCLAWLVVLVAVLWFPLSGLAGLCPRQGWYPETSFFMGLYAGVIALMVLPWCRWPAGFAPGASATAGSLHLQLPCEPIGRRTVLAVLGGHAVIVMIAIPLLVPRPQGQQAFLVGVCLSVPALVFALMFYPGRQVVLSPWKLRGALLGLWLGLTLGVHAIIEGKLDPLVQLVASFGPAVVLFLSQLLYPAPELPPRVSYRLGILALLWVSFIAVVESRAGAALAISLWVATYLGTLLAFRAFCGHPSVQPWVLLVSSLAVSAVSLALQNVSSSGDRVFFFFAVTPIAIVGSLALLASEMKRRRWWIGVLSTLGVAVLQAIATLWSSR